MILEKEVSVGEVVTIPAGRCGMNCSNGFMEFATSPQKGVIDRIADDEVYIKINDLPGFERTLTYRKNLFTKYDIE